VSPVRDLSALLCAGLTAGLLLFSGCTVSDAHLDSAFFTCAAPSDCGEGWSCVAETAYTPYFCAPECDPESCDGACVGENPSSCIRGCFIGRDGTPGPCPDEGFSCIRTSADSERGLCFPIDSCAQSADCEGAGACLSEILTEAGVENANNLYCVPTPEGTGCPDGSWEAFLSGSLEPICLPRCSVRDTRCPPSFACLSQLDRLAPLSPSIEGAVCTIGPYGLACQDDTNCFNGSCLETGSAQGQICTMTCNQASRIAGGCAGLIKPFTVEALLYTLECDEDAPSEDGSGLCTTRYTINFPGCTPEEDGAYPCASNLDCREVGFVGLRICTRSCAEDRECNEGAGDDPRAWLYECTDEGDCRFRSQVSADSP